MGLVYKAILKQIVYLFQPWFLEDHEVIVSLVIVRPDFRSISAKSVFWCQASRLVEHCNCSFVERGLFIKTFCHRKYLNRRIVYSPGHQGTFNPAVITNKEFEVHMVHGNINTNDETSHTTSNAVESWGLVKCHVTCDRHPTTLCSCHVLGACCK